MSNQAIAGVVPAETREATIMTVWPTISALPMGRSIGKLIENRSGFGKFFTFGKLFAVLSIPVALALFVYMVLPFVAKRYRLTNRRVVVERGIRARPESWVSLDDFDQIDVEVLPGQEWYHAGDLIFRKGTTVTLRLPGVSRPETFRQTVEKARRARVGVEKALAAVH